MAGGMTSSRWCQSRVAPRPTMRPDGKARRPRIPSVFEGGATPPVGMQRRSNAAGLAPRAATSLAGGGAVAQRDQCLSGFDESQLRTGRILERARIRLHPLGLFLQPGVLGFQLAQGLTDVLEF